MSFDGEKQGGGVNLVSTRLLLSVSVLFLAPSGERDRETGGCVERSERDAADGETVWMSKKTA